MSDVALPSDYDEGDCLQENLLEQCPHCENSLNPRCYSGQVFDKRGREYELITDTDPNERPFFCEECWPELEANRKRQTNHGLEAFGGGGGR